MILDLEVMSSRPTLSVELTFKKNLFKGRNDKGKFYLLLFAGPVLRLPGSYTLTFATKVKMTQQNHKA